ncbi:MAG TPA: transglycosylase SLT domain-containing protein [Pyrinomonadaceae bacterium]|jgi:hypothetical protein
MDSSVRIVNQPNARTDAPRAADARAPRRASTDFDRRLGQTQSREDNSRQQALNELRTLVRAIRSGNTDEWKLTELIFYSRHPHMRDVPLTKENGDLLEEWNSISTDLVHPTLRDVAEFDAARGAAEGSSEAGEVSAVLGSGADPVDASEALPGGSVNRYDDVIQNAAGLCPGLSPAVLKGLLAQESNFNARVINQYGYAGIAQFGREAAREVGLRVGVAGSETDERLNPSKAIPGAALLLNIKAQRLAETAFSRYGKPSGVEYWKFVLAAYNGGEGTVALAMGNAYRAALAVAGAKGLTGQGAVGFARDYASKWENLRAGGMGSPLALATARYFPTLAAQKYQEIGNYPKEIVERARRAGG